MHPTQFRFDALLKHPLADSHLEFHWAPCHDSKVLLLHSRGHTLLMWCWLASLTCCGGREPYMPLQEDRSLRQCWRWTAPASGRCHHSLRRREYSSGQWISTVTQRIWAVAAIVQGGRNVQELTYRAHTNGGWTYTRSHTQTSTRNLH